MIERFRLAANVLLKRRLNNLVRIDNDVEIDRGFITCAEYQLFIDDMRQKGNNLKPDHWTSERFPPGDAKKPVTGVRASDAAEFCQWLTQKESLVGFRYRLPSIAETKEILTTKENIGCWCKKENFWTISGITSQQWQSWQQKLSKYLIVRDDFVLNRDLNHDLNRVLKHFYYLDLNPNRDLDLKCVINLYLDFNRDLNLLLNLDLNPDLNLDLNLFLNRVLRRILNRVLNLDRNFNHNLNLVLKRFLNLDLNLDLNFNHDLYQKIDTGQASDLSLMYFPLIFVVVICHILKTVYGEAAQNNQIPERINLSRQECEEISKKYAQKRDEIYPIYVYLVLIDERRKGNMPAWEGIRIVREREEIN